MEKIYVRQETTHRQPVTARWVATLTLMLVGLAALLTPNAAQAQCTITIKPTVSGCYNTTAGSRATISVEVSWTSAPANTTISVTAGGLTRKITPGTISVNYGYQVGTSTQIIVTPQVVAFELPADASTQTIQAFFGSSFAAATCNASQSVTLPAACPPTPCSGNNVGGTVFNDFNADGIRQAGESTGIPNVIVNAYDCAGNLVGSDATDTNGAYSITAVTAGSYPLRLEFTSLPTYAGMGTPAGTDGRTTVQFINAPTCNANLGALDPTDYCQNNPKLVVPCYVYGDPLPAGSPSGARDALVGFDYATAGLMDMTKMQHAATAAQVGTLWGVAYNKFTKKLFSSATVKRHAGLGPLGIGGIYVTNMANPNAPTTTPFLSVTSLGVDVGTIVSNATRGLTTDPTAANVDNAGYLAAGKIGIGGLDFSSDGNTLYFTNLKDNKLYAVDITAYNAGGALPTSANVTPYNVGSNITCVGGNLHIWGVKVYKGKVYTGFVCDAGTSQNKSDLRAYIQQLTGTTVSTAFDFPLTYPKGFPNNTTPTITGWYPWTDDWTKKSSGVYPEPILSSIEFDIDGSMVLALGDRTGIQTGYKNYNPNGNDGKLYSGIAGGDLLRAYSNGSTFVLENNAKAGPAVGYGATNNQGPGFGEFYNDNFLYDVYILHAENALGGLALRPGSGEVVAVTMDPLNFPVGGNDATGNSYVYTGGVRHLNNTTGQVNSSYVIYESNNITGTFGKASGLGDAVLTCGTPTYLEIGNRVWSDKNLDGVQSPCEPPLAGVTVAFYQGTTLIATTLTNASGEYYFNNNPVASTVTGTASTTNLLPNTAYSIVFGNTQFANNTLTLAGNKYALTQANSSTTNANDMNDSDALVATVAGITAPVISLTTPAAGAVNHTYDVGFYQLASLGDYVFLDKNANGQQDTGIDTPIQGVVVTLVSNGTVVATTTTNASGNYSFTGLTPGKPYSVSFTAPVGYVATTPNTGPDATDSDPVGGITAPVTLTAGENNPTLDAGFVLPASLGDYAFIDLDKNGIQSTGDQPVPNLLVTLYLNGSAIATTTTDASGLYSFTGLTPGSSNSYSVGFATPNGYTATTTNTGSNSAIDSDLIAATGRTISYTLSSGQNNTSIDAGFVCQLPTINTSNLSVCAGSSVSLTALISPTGSYTYAWSGPAGVVITNGGSATATASSLPSGPNTFTVTVTTTPYCSTTATLTVTVNALPTPTLSSASICAGQSTTLTASGGSSYSLTPGNVVNTTGLFTLTPTATTTYTLTAASVAGCTAVTTGTVTVNPLPVAALTSASICTGQSTTLTASGGTSYTLTPGNIVNTSGVFALTPGGTTTYTLTAANASGCKSTTTGTVTVNVPPVATLNSATICAGQSATLTATGGSSYTLAPGNVVNTSGVFVLTPTSSTTYTVTAFDGCSATATGTVTVNPLPVTTLTSATICAGQSATLTASGGSSYSLTPGNVVNTTGLFTLTPTATATYTITAATANGCSATATGSITVNPQPVATLTSASICTDQSATLTATGGTSYTLTPGNVVNTSGVFALSPATTTSYTVVAINASGCSATATGSVTVNLLPAPTLTSASICAGQSATLTATGGTSYSLSPSNVINTSGVFTLSPAGTTTYTLTASNASGCLATTTSTVTVNPQPAILILNTTCNGSTTYSVNLSATAGATITANAGTVSGSQVLNVPSGTALTITVTLGSCSATASVSRDCASNVASLGDKVFEDINANGIQDAGIDKPIVGAVVGLLSNGNLIATTTTDGSGLYSFTGLTPGQPYSVSFTAPTGFKPTAQQVAIGTDANNSDASPITGQTRSVTLAPGENNPDLDAGFYKPASLGNYVFIDTNRDGIQNTDDMALPGVIVTLVSNGSVVATTTTNATGNYSFTGLTPGKPYAVSFTTPATYSATTPLSGTDTALDSDPVGGITAPVTLTSGENNPTLDAGFVLPLPTYALAKTVDLKQVEKGGIVTYTVSLTNTSGTTATGLVLTDQLSSTAITLVGSATTSAGSFAPGLNSGTWSLSSLAGGQVATLVFRAQLNEEGITYNTVTLPGQQTATVCTSVPAHVCAGVSFQFDLTAPASYSTYQWSRNGTPIPGATSSTYSATAIGEYTVSAVSTGGCPDGSCCPYIIVADPAPSLTALAVSAQCVGQTPQSNGAITLVGSSTNAVGYNITKGSSFTAATPLFATPQNLSAVVGGVLIGGQPNPALAQDYTIRVYAANGCYADTVVTIQPTVCGCPPATCAPIVVKKTKSQGNPVAP